MSYMRKAPSATAGFEDRARCHEPMRAGSLQTEVGKDEEVDSPLGPPEENMYC